MRSWNFQFKLFDTAVTLKHNQGHWKWYEWIKLNEYNHHARFDVYHIYNVWENYDVKLLPQTDTQPASCLTLSITQTHILHVSKKYTPLYIYFHKIHTFLCTQRIKHKTKCQLTCQILHSLRSQSQKPRALIWMHHTERTICWYQILTVTLQYNWFDSLHSNKKNI